MGIATITYHIYHCKLKNPNPGAKYFSISVASLAAIGKEIFDKYYRKTRISYKDLVVSFVGIAFSILFM